MTPAEITDLLERARANTSPYRIASGIQTRLRWQQWRAERKKES